MVDLRRNGGQQHQQKRRESGESGVREGLESSGGVDRDSVDDHHHMLSYFLRASDYFFLNASKLMRLSHNLFVP